MKNRYRFLLILWCIVLSSYLYIIFLLPLKISPMVSSMIIEDMHHVEIGEIIAANNSIRHRKIEYADIPQFYLSGIVWLEDRSFSQNNGISLRGIARSIVRNFEAGKVVEWASTLSAQLIRNALWINEKRDLKHKVLESMYAVRLNHIMSKKEILTEYVNRIGFWYLNYGLRSASIYYFNKEPRFLTKAEQIALLVIPKNPNIYDPYRKPQSFQNRFDMIVSLLASWGLIQWSEVDSIKSEKLLFQNDHSTQLPYVMDFLQSKEIIQESKLTTTIDKALTHQIDILSRSVLDELSWRNVSDYGVLIAERTPHWPELRVMIGGKDYHEREEWQVNTTTSLRQPWSTLKPFTYLLAFSQKWLTPESMITDLPVQYKTAEGYSYEPKNFSQSYQWEVTLRQALSQSINIPAIKLLELVGVESLLQLLKRIWITSLDKSADHYGLALTLGDGEVTLYELLQSYSIFAYDWKYCPIQYNWAHIEPCTQVIDKWFTDMIVSILSDRYAKLEEFPLHSSLDFPDRWVALKTGTSRNFRDNWTVGFTNHYMIGVWTGNKNGENMKWVSGATGAWEIFARIVYALETEEYTPEITPDIWVSRDFLEITSPLQGSIYKKEKNKPDEIQKISLSYRTNIKYDRVVWKLNNIELNSALLPITLGKHKVEIIIMKDNNEIASEKSIFEVKED